MAGFQLLKKKPFTRLPSVPETALLSAPKLNPPASNPHDYQRQNISGQR